MKASDLRVPPEMPVEELIHFLEGIVYAEKYYGIGVPTVKQEVEFEEMEAKE